MLIYVIRFIGFFKVCRSRCKCVGQQFLCDMFHYTAGQTVCLRTTFEECDEMSCDSFVRYFVGNILSA